MLAMGRLLSFILSKYFSRSVVSKRRHVLLQWCRQTLVKMFLRVAYFFFRDVVPHAGGHQKAEVVHTKRTPVTSNVRAFTGI